IAADTLATQIAVLPLLLWMTGSISSYALPANILALPAVPLAMFLGFFTGLFGFISDILAFPFAAISHILLSYIFLIAEFFAGLPFASLTLLAS
ncbi:ComEC/Rec2 family competence protein, partial [bacterium]|nr:ComEC/Rec2 family competence protein [bacterium]